MKVSTLILLAALTAVAADNPRYVSLNVVATDSHGQPVADLTAADFQVLDGPKAQELSFFRLTPVKLQPLAAPAAREFSNRASGTFPHTTLILLDLLNSQMSDRGFSPAEMARNLQGLETSESLYFYLLTKDAKLFPVRGLPDGPADIKPETAPWTKKIRPMLDEALQKVNKLRPGDRLLDTQIKQTYAALQMVVSTLGMMPGRNSVIWISHGVPISVRLPSGDDEVKYTPQLKQLATACERTRTIIYTIDPTGDTPTSEIGTASVATLEQMAALTGGVAYRGDVIGATTRQAMADGRAHYRLEYSMASDGWDGKLHKLKVTCARKGVNLQAKQSFYADAPAEGELDRVALQLAVNSPFDNPDVGLRVSLAPGKTAQSARVHIVIDPADAMLTHQGDQYSGQWDVAFVQYGPDGPKAVSSPIVARLNLTQAQYDAAAKSGIALDEDAAVGAGITKLRAIVYDRGAGLTGSLTVPVGDK